MKSLTPGAAQMTRQQRHKQEREAEKIGRYFARRREKAGLV